MEPRPAATVVVVRPAADGVEALTLRRHAGSRFAPGYIVFPGGVVEDEDERHAKEWFGDPAEVPRACALRELYEETGILVTAGGPVATTPDRPIGAVTFDPPPADALTEMARWVAPEFLEVRFDAYFYALGVDRDLTVTVDGVEIDSARWSRAADILEASHDGDAPLMWPTLVTLERLVDCRSVEDVLSLRVEQIAPGEAERPATVRGAWSRPEGGSPA